MWKLLKMDRQQIPAFHRSLAEMQIPVISLQPRHSLEDYFLQVTTGNQHVETFTNGQAANTCISPLAGRNADTSNFSSAKAFIRRLFFTGNNRKPTCGNFYKWTGSKYLHFTARWQKCRYQ